MTTEDLNDLIENITTDLDMDTTKTEAAGIDSTLLPCLIIGRALAQQLPGLAEAVSNWMAGNLPTEDEQQELIQKLLSDSAAPT